MNMDQLNEYRNAKDAAMRGMREPNVPMRDEHLTGGIKVKKDLLSREAETSHNVTTEVE